MIIRSEVHNQRPPPTGTFGRGRSAKQGSLSGTVDQTPCLLRPFVLGDETGRVPVMEIVHQLVMR
jgi:hypothetical protein